MPQVITGTQTSALTLSTANAIVVSEAEINADGAFGTVAGLGGDFFPVYGAVFAPESLVAVSVLNAGWIEAVGDREGVLDVGVLLATGGFFDNGLTGTISASGLAEAYAVVAGSVASVVNQGMLSGGGGIFLSGGAVSNSGLIDVTGDGVNLASAAYVTNASEGKIISTSGLRNRNIYAGIGAGQMAGTPTINNAGLIGGQYFGIDLAGTGAIINTGSIGAQFALGYGVALREGGIIDNDGGLISGGYFGAELGALSADTIINGGTITGFAASRLFHPGLGIGAGLYSNVSNQLSNSSGGIIAGAETGVVLGNHGGGIFNDGTISGDGRYGIYLNAITPSRVSNTGLITGGIDGIRVSHEAATIINAGIIAGSVDSVMFDAGFAGRLIVEPGARFYGVADGGNMLGSSIGSVLEFSGTSPGTITNFNAAFSDFATILIDPGATWTLSDITLEPDQVITSSGNISIEVVGSVVTFIATPVACFASGTRILCSGGEIPVERLNIGDLIVTADGEAVPIKWIGRRHIDLTRQPDPEKMQPIRIATDAMADGIPARDLYLSPDHALYFENCLIPAKALLNHRNVTQERLRTITYYHIQLEAHAIIFAESTAVETYLETGNRSCFENAPIVSWYSDFNPDQFQAVRESQSCADFVETGTVVEQLRSILLTRAFRALSWTRVLRQ